MDEVGVLGVLCYQCRRACNKLVCWIGDRPFISWPDWHRTSLLGAQYGGRQQSMAETQIAVTRGRTKQMQATARMASVVSSTLPARRRLIRDVRQKYEES